uniref:Carboxylesterase type B domain-containing protein n=1 Tax=Panagrolaimus davidi TaxID=227884 RepID=A0A914PPF4_9BILA
MGYQFRFIAKDSGENAIAPRSYEEMLNETLPIPILSGTVAKEFLYSKHTIIKLPNDTLGINQTELKIWAKRSIENFHYLNPKPTTIAATVKEYNSIPKSAYIFDDVEQYVPTYNYAVNQILRGSDVYLYEYIYQDVGGAFDTGPDGIYKIPRYLSPKHAQELSYLLGLHVGNFTSKDHQIRYLYSQIFIDFINYGTPKSPTRNWKKFNPKKGNYFVIDFPDPYLKAPGNKNGYHSEAVKFWNTILPRLEGRPKTIIQSESQISYDPYIEKSMIKRSVPNLNENIKTTFLSLPEEDRTLFFNLAMILWILFVIIGILVLIQIFMFLKLAFKRKDYTKV